MVCYIVSCLSPTLIVIYKIWSQVFLTIMPTIFTAVYQESLGISGLHYVALGLGLTGASQINARMLDRIYIHFKNKNNGVGEPEFRLRTLQCTYYSFFLKPFVLGNSLRIRRCRDASDWLIHIRMGSSSPCPLGCHGLGKLAILRRVYRAQ